MLEQAVAVAPPAPAEEEGGDTACREATADGDAGGDADAGIDEATDAGADGEAGADATALEVAGLAGADDDEEDGDAVHPVTPTPAITAAAPIATR